MKTHNTKDNTAPNDRYEVPSLTVAEFCPDDGWLENIAKLLILARSANSFPSREPQLNQQKAH